MQSRTTTGLRRAGFAIGALALAALPVTAQAEWKPTRNIEFIVPAGTGGGADQMARMIQGIVEKHGLIDKSVVVINKSGGAGAEGFLDVKESAGNPHKIIITLSNLFTTPLATGVPFSWEDLTPVAMLALDEFVLWVNTSDPSQTAQEYVEAANKAGAGANKMGGTGSKQEDQIITAAIEQSTGAKFTYVPFKGGGEVATQLVGGHVNSTVNNPIEAVAHWRSGALRPLCVFDKEPMTYTDKVTDTAAWSDIPTCRSAGIDMDYLMLRGIFTTPGAEQEVVDFYIDLFKKVRETPEWKEFMAKGAFNQSFMTGDEFKVWLKETNERHKDLMTKAGFLAQ
ncbi:MAG TPA: tripartite tricarboxylate transporter substrate-binding protein [Alphaproteobacteria bacterium]|nr:tripartite tricarboxylate transporter substrate-binding protein [Alphaproteobacteria bacterium]